MESSPTTMTIQVQCAHSACGRRRQRRCSLAMTSIIFVASLVATVSAESGVVHRGSTIPPPPPPPRFSSRTSKVEVPPPPPKAPQKDDETPTRRKELSSEQLPPPPPPRKMPATTGEEYWIASGTRQAASKIVPPPPTRSSKPFPVILQNNMLSRGEDRGFHEVRIAEEDDVMSEKEASQTKQPPTTDMLSDEKHVVKVEPKEETNPSSLQDQTDIETTPTSTTEDIVDYSFRSPSEASDDRLLSRPPPRGVVPSDQLSLQKDSPQGGQQGDATSTQASSQARFIVSTADMIDRSGPARSQDRMEPPQKHFQPQAYGSPKYQDSSQQPPPRNAYQSPPRNQYRPPQPQYRPQEARPVESSAISSTWKSLWGKVERGLDGLAQIEDSVTVRAQQIFSSVASSSPNRPASSADDTIRRVARERSAKVSTPTKTPLTPYGNKYEIAKKQKLDSSKSEQMKDNSGLKSPLTWNEMSTGKMIRANGGASSPDGQHPLPPSNPSFVSTQTQTNPVPLTGPGGAPNQQVIGQNTQSITQGSQYIANPYLQSNKTPPKEPSPVADAHSRSSRIPWDSSASSSSSGPSSNQPPRRPSASFKPDYETDKASFMSKILKIIPPIPKFSSPLKLFRKSSYQYAGMDAWNVDEDEEAKGGGLFGLFRRKQGGQLPLATTRPAVKSGDSLAPPLKSMMDRRGSGKATSLLSASDKTSCRIIGRYQAFFDGLCVLFVLIGIQQADGLGNISLPISLDEFVFTTLPKFGSILRDASYTWAPIFAGYAYLALYMKRAILGSRVRSLANNIGSAVEEESQYAQLYLRLAAAIRMDPSLPANLRLAAASQVRSVVSTARLNAFVTMVLGSLIVMTVTVIGPVLTALGNGASQLVMLDEWRSWPIAWKPLGSSIQHILKSLGVTLESLMARGANTFLENPIQFAFHLSIFVSVLLITLIPGIERRKKVGVDKDDDEEISISSGESAQQFAKLGASSATRLTMLSENGSIESALERWRSNRATMADESSSGSIFPTIRRLAYTLLVAIIATLPIVVSYLIGMTSDKGIAHVGLQWNSILDVSVVLVGVFIVASNAIASVVSFSQKRATVKSFLSLLANTLEEIKETNRRQTDIQFMASVSPTAGLVVKDLWAAHTTKRAWAVRGANLQCKNGEILAVLGDDGTGKTRMLTTIAESLISPPRRSLTSNKVRGVVAIGGVESSKWDKTVLKRRLGVLLSDVRTVADTASLYSGWTMEEILEPVDGLRVRSTDVDHKLSSDEKSSILLALKITGLYSTLIPKLQSKLSTVLTANEEDLRPSALRPRCQVLSPAEWSKLLLAKVLAQTIYDNDNAAASTDKVENCMIGSVLILDDPTVQLSEVEEAKVLKDLRQTGAATVLATNKWATGRFADHIVVVRDGAIVESGTHNELISRGPQQSLYAAKWHAMTMQ